MKILVTGASGFVGSALLPLLRARGHEVAEATRGSSPTQMLSGVRSVIHLANIAHSRVAREALWEVNVRGTIELAERAAVAGVARFVYLSSIKASGERTAARPFDGTEPPAPEDEYGRSKLAAERGLADVALRTGLATTVLRPPLVYGPGVKANFLSLIRAIHAGLPLPLADIANRRSLVYVGNLADAISLCVESPAAQGRIYTLSDGDSVSTPELCRAISRALDRPVRLYSLPGSLLRWIPGARALLSSLEVDDSAIRSELGWKRPYSFDDGLRSTARWYRAR